MAHNQNPYQQAVLEQTHSLLSRKLSHGESQQQLNEWVPRIRSSWGANAGVTDRGSLWIELHDHDTEVNVMKLKRLAFAILADSEVQRVFSRGVWRCTSADSASKMK